MKIGFKLRKIWIDFVDVFRRLTNIFGYLVWLVFDPMKFNSIKTSKIKKLLVCDTGGGIGDILSTLGLINSFKAIYKDVKVFLVLEKKRLNLAEGNPKIKLISTIPDYKPDNFLNLKNERFKLAIGSHPQLKIISSQISEISKKFKIDAAILITSKSSFFIDKIKMITTMQNDSFRSNITLANFFVTRRKFPRVIHKTKGRKHCFELLGFKLPNKLEFYSNKQDKLKAKRFYNEINPKKKKIILFNPDSGTSERARNLGLFPSHDWPYFSKLAEKFVDYLVLITGTKKNEQYAQNIILNCKNKKNIKSICGKLSVRELGEFMKLCDLLVSVDTGLVHTATQVGIPVIDLMGPYPKELYYAWPASSNAITLYPSGVCRGCRKCYCAEKNNICMKSISVEEVYKIVGKLKI